MLSDVAIQLRGVSKVFEIYNRPSDRLKQMLWGKRRQFYREFWAVKDIDLEVYRGETVGIVGRNGAGKSTLLQMICGTLQPTTGEMTVRGRIAALLELGAGFNPEFTGRENVFINAAILGLSQQEIEQRFDNIAAFASIGDFIDQPVNVYSSGMYARLAFAVAINVDPDILVVDEALAVGDEAFQRKCYARLEQIRDSGGTVLFVSHSAGKIVELCDRAVLLDRGKRMITGKPKTVISQYQRLIYAPLKKDDQIRQEIRLLDQGVIEEAVTPAKTKESPKPAKPESIVPIEPDNEGYIPNLKPASTVEYVQQGGEIYNIRILNQVEKLVNLLIAGRQYTYAYRVKITKPVEKVRCAMLIKTKSGIELGGMLTHPTGQGIDCLNAGKVLDVRFQFRAALTPGTYFLNAGVVGCVDGQEGFLHRILDAAMFRVEPLPKSVIRGYVDFSVNQKETVRILDDPEVNSFPSLTLS